MNTTKLSEQKYLFHSGQTYCVYNDMTDGTKIHVVQINADRFSAFKKWISPGNRECCPFTNHDCCFSQVKWELTNFRVKFEFPLYTSEYKLINCRGGGALVLKGSLAGGYWGECTDDEGVTRQLAFGEDRVY
ncbi:hypothetical protein BDF20DRAFT_837171 [Mycotypha africana]|uniref:uncharacterized protein n=1 Tax=Mycotypha africana TaxID=64632 RepID=UPI0023018897|nr:uncharacterized protein BDF20DRAFT_837171 [Mycotypha africana]KAI8973203.1 hypothetical protein BDF20DRAFT_837171 [Mycotypha africana]